jgi:hypothetical protein
MLPPGVSVDAFADFVMPTCGADVATADAMHGGAVLPGPHTPPGGFALAVFVTCAGAVPLIVAVSV